MAIFCRILLILHLFGIFPPNEAIVYCFSLLEWTSHAVKSKFLIDSDKLAIIFELEIFVLFVFLECQNIGLI